MESKDLLTIKEFAEKAGVSQQRIYQRLAKDLKPYLKMVENKKMLKIEALELFNIKGFEQGLEQGFEQGLEQILISSLTETIEVLREQLNVKDQQIENLNTRLAEANELNRNNQVLMREKGFLLEPENIEKRPEPSKTVETRQAWKFWRK